MAYLLSIIIPTKDRYQYLSDCILSLKDLSPEKIEIIIQDNSELNSEFLAFLKNNAGDNVKYYHQLGKLSQTENSDLAVSHATGKYCCFIGDDDTVSSAIIGIAEYMEKNEIKACVCDVATYYWDDVVFESGKRPPLSFVSKKPSVKKLCADKILKKVLSYGLQDIKYLARVYHGIISRDVLLQVQSKTGSFFPGPSPDMANAISCTTLLKDYIYVNAPLIVSGYSYKSAGGMGLRGAHKGSLKDSKQLPDNVEEGWDERIPKLWLGYTMWPQSGISAFKAMGLGSYIKKMNYDAMYAKTYLRYPEYKEVVLRFVSENKSMLKFALEIIRFSFRWGRERIVNQYRKLFHIQFIDWKQLTLSEAKQVVDKENSKSELVNK